MSERGYAPILLAPDAAPVAVEAVAVGRQHLEPPERDPSAVGLGVRAVAHGSARGSSANGDSCSHMNATRATMRAFRQVRQ